MLDNVFAKENLPESKVQWILANDFGDLLMASFWDSKPYSCYKRLFPNQEWEGVSLVWTYSYMTMNLPVVSCETCYESPNPCFLINIEQKCWCWGTSDPYRLGSHAGQHVLEGIFSNHALRFLSHTPGLPLHYFPSPLSPINRVWLIISSNRNMLQSTGMLGVETKRKTTDLLIAKTYLTVKVS